MLNRFPRLFCVASVAALLSAVPAAALVKVATYTGTIRAGYDQTGVFGAPGTDLTGFRYVTKYTYDKALGATQSPVGAPYDASYGYAYLGSPIIANSITINGVTKSLPRDHYGEVHVSADGFELHLNRYAFYNGFDLIDSIIYNYDYAPSAASLDQNWGPVAQTGNGEGLMRFYAAFEDQVFVSAYAELNADGTYSVTDPVPEPSAWALMVAGFGLIGAALRRRDRRLIA